MSRDPIRCLLAMLGTDVHSKGIRTLAQLLRDRGVEVIYLGEHNTAEGVINALIAEDADLIGLSYSTATYLHYTRDLMQKMRTAGVGDVPVMLGGLIHADDEPALREMGVRGIFGPGSTLTDIVDFLQRVTSKSLPGAPS
ncbi:methylmalonyl-CoA mutase, C-terminal domain [Variovorax sp. HW608]|uniref:cobalamin B12-binding domain-containing protein n=1 Tax=Variovorax sp. HW608 TaxID=1034889 RepID=UPI00081F915A|nr:cobalamin-dependent protein [Variovorax sp. HW608]SCK10802.1 methylmalonyl-CoA mutase, C-terminal domain [Variovorax sp. HW608]